MPFPPVPSRDLSLREPVRASRLVVRGRFAHPTKLRPPPAMDSRPTGRVGRSVRDGYSRLCGDVKSTSYKERATAGRRSRDDRVANAWLLTPFTGNADSRFSLPPRRQRASLLRLWSSPGSASTHVLFFRHNRSTSPKRIVSLHETDDSRCLICSAAEPSPSSARVEAVIS